MPSNIELLLRDPLDEVTRRERTHLLLSSLVAVVVSKAGILPTKIESLGIEFTSSNRHAIIVLLGVVVGYFLLAFIVYGFFDIYFVFSSRREANAEELSKLVEEELAARDRRSLDRVSEMELRHQIRRRMQRRREEYPSSRAPLAMFWWRAVLFEWGLPVFAGGYAILSLIHTK
jgi:hypothetical protein